MADDTKDSPKEDMFDEVAQLPEWKMAYLKEAQTAFNVADAEISKWERIVGFDTSMVACRQRMAEAWFWLQGVIANYERPVKIVEMDLGGGQKQDDDRPLIVTPNLTKFPPH